MLLLIQNISQTVDGHLDVADSKIYCPFLNPSKTVDQEALSSLLRSPLSIHHASKLQRHGERIYLDKYHSVTSILSQTKPASEHFALKNWKKSQISELGKEQFKKNTKNTFKKGTLFHQVSILHCLRLPCTFKGCCDFFGKKFFTLNQRFQTPLKFAKEMIDNEINDIMVDFKLSDKVIKVK